MRSFMVRFVALALCLGLIGILSSAASGQQKKEEKEKEKEKFLLLAHIGDAAIRVTATDADDAKIARIVRDVAAGGVRVIPLAGKESTVTVTVLNGGKKPLRFRFTSSAKGGDGTVAAGATATKTVTVTAPEPAPKAPAKDKGKGKAKGKAKGKDAPAFDYSNLFAVLPE